jgi:hypothetical protein
LKNFNIILDFLPARWTITMNDTCSIFYHPFTSFAMFCHTNHSIYVVLPHFLQLYLRFDPSNPCSVISVDPHSGHTLYPSNTLIVAIRLICIYLCYIYLIMAINNNPRTDFA